MILMVSLGVFNFGLDYLEEDQSGTLIDVRNWVSMAVTLVIPGALAVIIWRYSHYKNEETAKMIEDIQNLSKSLKQEKQNRRFFALSRLRINVNQIIHYLQDMEKKLTNSKYTDSEIVSCLQNAKANIRDIEDISKIAASDIEPSLSNTLRKRCDFLNLYCTTYKVHDTIGPKRAGLLDAFEKSFLDVSSNFHNNIE